MTDIVAIKPKPEGTPPQSAREGTRMYKRSDVLGILRKYSHYARRNLRAAEDEERWRDADVMRVRLRAFDMVYEALLVIPEFTNPADVIAVERPASGTEAGTGETACGLDPKDDGPVRDSADAHNEDGPNPSLDGVMPGDLNP